MAAFPRIQTLVIFMVCTFAVLGVAYYVHGDFWNTEEINPLNDLAAAAITSDSQQVLDVNYDWTKQFLNDDSETAFVKPQTTPVKASSQKKLSPTQALAQNFLTKYGELNQVGLTDDPASVAAVMDQVIIDASKEMKPPKGYTQKDIVVLQDTSALLKNYALTVEGIYEFYDNQPFEAEVVISAFESGDMTKLKSLDPIISNYKSMIKKLSDTPVPQSLANYHLDLLNGLSLALYSTEAFRNFDVEPFLGFASLRLSALAVHDITAAYEAIEKIYDL